MNRQMFGLRCIAEHPTFALLVRWVPRTVAASRRFRTLGRGCWFADAHCSWHHDRSAGESGICGSGVRDGRNALPVPFEECGTSLLLWI
jgi:hypothetical protein